MTRSALPCVAAFFAANLALTACTRHANAPAPLAPREARLYGLQWKSGSILPVVHGTIHGRPTYFIVDTGAQIPVVEASFAAAVHLDLREANATAHDPAGNMIRIKTAAAPDFAIDGWGSIENRNVVVIDLGDMFRRSGIGGIISPQALATPDESVVIDLKEQVMKRAPRSDPHREFNDPAKFTAFPEMRLCTYEDNGLQARALVGIAFIDGVAIHVEVDTGADRAMVIRDSDAARQLAKRPGRDASAAGALGSFKTTEIKNVPVKIGERTLEETVSISAGEPDPRCGYEGRVGVPDLRSCKILIGVDKADLFCELHPTAPIAPIPK